MSKRILVVEDQPDNRQIIRDMLAPTDYEITEAENGEEALAAIAKQRPDLILMDIQLPIMDGYTATSRIKADPALRSIPIIAVTSYVLSGEEQKARQLAAMTMCRNLSAHAHPQQPSRTKAMAEALQRRDAPAAAGKMSRKSFALHHDSGCRFLARSRPT
jgi:two-component system, cell cycle response regulator DivK